LGLSYFKLANYREAISKFNKELEIAVEDNIYISIGDCEYALGNINDALAYYDKAISFNPKSFEAYNSKTVIYRQLLKLEDAYESSTKSLDIQPLNIKGLMNLGLVLKTFRRHRDAIQVFDEILKIKANDVNALFNKASCLELIDQHEETLNTFEKLHAINPYHDYLSGSYLNAKLRTYSWSHYDKNKEYLKDVLQKDVLTSAPFLYLAVADVKTQYVASTKYVSQQFAKEKENVCNWRASNRKLRIAYFSADFRQHAVSRLTVELFELHDRQQFEIIGFSFQNAAEDDELGKRVKSSFDQFIDLEGVPFEKALTTIREFEVDIAIDLGGHTEGSPLGYFNRYVAPIQISYIGHPGTTGADFIHYTIADENLIPEQYQKYYSEKIIYMPDCFQVNDSKRIMPTDQLTRSELNFPEDRFIFCCFNNSYKINPMMFDVWMKILRKVPNSILWILATEPYSENNLIKEVKKRHIDPSRVIFAQRVKYQQYLSRFKVADLFLDTLPFNAGTTASDALWAGLPVVTCLGDSFSGRMAGSLLKAIDMPELITNSLEEYEQLAI
jgi:predicted O-linked N-acetylglucosamine transferase (SPINDLY family)